MNVRVCQIMLDEVAAGMAWFKAELLRQASAPTWLLLWVMWSLTLALLTLIALDQAAHQVLASGQHIFGHALQMAPQLLLILPLLLLPQLGVAALAGRRERGRLEHLTVSGGSLLGLLTGHLMAGGLLAGSLIVPLLIVAWSVADLRPILSGDILAPIVVLWVVAIVSQGIGLACGAWSSRQLAGTVTASGLTLLWWLVDMLSPLLGADSSALAPWSLSLALHHAAEGRIDLAWLMGQGVLMLFLLIIAHSGLSRRSHWQRRSLAMVQILVAVPALILVSQAAAFNKSWQVSGHRGWQLDQAVEQAARDLDDLSVTVIADGSDTDQRDALTRTGFSLIQQQLQQLGASVTWIDRSQQPRRAAPWFASLALHPTEWQQTIMVLQAQGRERVIRAMDVFPVSNESQSDSTKASNWAEFLITRC